MACPGRLADLVQRRDVDLGDVDLVVIDEADRMADMGFLPEVSRLLDQVKPDRQTLLFSATLDRDVDVLIRRYQHDPVRHEVVPPRGRRSHRALFWKAEPNHRAQRRALVPARPRHRVLPHQRRADRLAKPARPGPV